MCIAILSLLSDFLLAQNFDTMVLFFNNKLEKVRNGTKPSFTVLGLMLLSLEGRRSGREEALQAICEAEHESALQGPLVLQTMASADGTLLICSFTYLAPRSPATT